MVVGVCLRSAWGAVGIAAIAEGPLWRSHDGTTRGDRSVTIFFVGGVGIWGAVGISAIAEDHLWRSHVGTTRGDHSMGSA